MSRAQQRTPTLATGANTIVRRGSARSRAGRLLCRQRDSAAVAGREKKCSRAGPGLTRLDLADRSSARFGGRRCSSPPWDQHRRPARTTASIRALARRLQACDARLWRDARRLRQSVRHLVWRPCATLVDTRLGGSVRSRGKSVGVDHGDVCCAGTVRGCWHGEAACRESPLGVRSAADVPWVAPRSNRQAGRASI
jgi:hypothetical protein